MLGGGREAGERNGRRERRGGGERRQAGGTGMSGAAERWAGRWVRRWTSEVNEEGVGR